MPMPAKSSWRKKSMRRRSPTPLSSNHKLPSRSTAGAQDTVLMPRGRRKRVSKDAPEGCAGPARAGASFEAPPGRLRTRGGFGVAQTAKNERRASVLELDMLVEDDHAFFIAHDVVAVQAVAEFVEIVFALGALVALGRQDRGANLVGVGRAGLVDGGAQHADRVVGPRAVIVRRSFRYFGVKPGEFLRLRARIDGVVGDPEGAPERRAGKFHRAGDDDRGRTDPGERHAELPELAGEDRDVVIEGEIRADDVGARGFDRKHDRREILALVGITLVDRDLRPALVERSR